MSTRARSERRRAAHKQLQRKIDRDNAPPKSTIGRPAHPIKWAADSGNPIPKTRDGRPCHRCGTDTRATGQCADCETKAQTARLKAAGLPWKFTRMGSKVEGDA